MKFEDLKNVIYSNELQSDILRNLCGVPLESITDAENDVERERPCPKCGGNTRFRIIDLERGSVYCSHCCRNRDEGSGDIIGAVKWAQGLESDLDAAKKIEDYLNGRGYISTPNWRNGGAKMNDNTVTTNRQVNNRNRADVSLTMNAGGVTYSESGEPGKTIKTTFFHRFDPKTETTSTARRDDLGDGSKRCQWLTTQKDVHGKKIYAPYIAGAATTTDAPPLNRLPLLWGDVYKAPRIYIVEGEKCAESLKNALKTSDLDGAVLTMGACSLAQYWGDPVQNWARFISGKNPNAEIIVFGDNDDSGKKAAQTTAKAFHAAGFPKITILDMARRFDGSNAPDKYDIADWLEEAPASSLGGELGKLIKSGRDDWNDLPKPQQLEMNASGVAYKGQSEPVTAADLRAICVQRQRERLQEQARKRAAESLEEIDVDALNKSFPLKALPSALQNMVKALGDRHGTPYATNAAVGLSAVSGVLGCHKTDYLYGGRPINPLIHTFIIGNQGAGKSETTNAFLNPIAAQIETKWDEWLKEQQMNAPALEQEWQELGKKKDLTDDDKKRRGEIFRIQQLNHWGGERIRLSGGSSLEALWYQAAMNECAAEVHGKKQHGIVFTLGDATKRVKTDTRKTDGEAAEYWAAANDVMDFNETPKKAVMDKGREVAKAGASWILNVQPKHCYFVNGGDTLAGGFARRFLWSCLPSKDEEEAPQEIDLSSLQASLLNLYNAILDWGGGNFNYDYQKAYQEWRAKMVRRYNKVRRDDEDLAAYLKTLYDWTIHRLTLLLHVCQNVEAGRVPETITLKAFKNAAQLLEAFLEMRNLTWRIMKNAVNPSKKIKTDDDAPKSLDELSPKARKVYLTIRNVGEQRGEDRAATVTIIREHVGAYRKLENQNAIDAELYAAGLIYIDPETGERNEKPKRVALPVYALDDFSGEMVETPKEEQPALVNDAAQPPLDYATEEELLSTSSIREASQYSNIDKETFPEFDQFDDASDAPAVDSDECPF